MPARYPADPAAVLETAMKRIKAEFHESKEVSYA
jgi:hypothetical protein